MRNLWKKFPVSSGPCSCLLKNKGKTKVAVKNLSIGFQRGEIFGLLGKKFCGTFEKFCYFLNQFLWLFRSVFISMTQFFIAGPNGAGKTTAFSMVTGEVFQDEVSRGRRFFHGSCCRLRRRMVR